MTAADALSDFTQQLLEALPRLRRKALCLTNNEAAAADLVQETIANALRGLDHFQPGTSAQAWLLRILFNLFVDERRRRRREISLSDETLALLDARHAQVELDPEPALRSEGVSLEAVHEAVVQLPPRFREPFELRVSGKLSYKKIATRLGIRQQTVGTRLHRGRQLLRRMLSVQPAD
jgi:RNA polymerase sigma-70 factor (ECF subfamily)